MQLHYSGDVTKGEWTQRLSSMGMQSCIHLGKDVHWWAPLETPGDHLCTWCSSHVCKEFHQQWARHWWVVVKAAMRSDGWGWQGGETAGKRKRDYHEEVPATTVCCLCICVSSDYILYAFPSRIFAFWGKLAIRAFFHIENTSNPIDNWFLIENSCHFDLLTANTRKKSTFDVTQTRHHTSPSIAKRERLITMLLEFCPKEIGT